MSKDNNNIDQLFSDAAHSQKAPQYDSAYWAEMNAMLNKKDAKRRGFILWTFGGSVVFAALFSSLFIVNIDLNQPEERYAQAALSKDINVEQTQTANQQLNGENLQENNIYTAENAVGNLQLKENVSAKKEADLENAVIQPNLLTPIENKKGIAKSDSRSETKAPLTPNYPLVKEDEVTPEITRKNESNSSEVKTADLLTDYARNNLDEELMVEGDIHSLPYNQLNNIQQQDPGNPFKSKLKYKPRPHLTIYAKMSGGLMENYKTSRPYESGLVDLSLNIEMNFDGLLLRTGVGAQHTSNADLIVSKRAKVYGFGVTRHQNDLSYQSLFDIYIPLELGYRINATSFGIGAQANYLMTTGMDLNLYEDNFLVDTEKYYGNKNGLNSFSTQGYVWMEHQLTTRFSLGAKVGTNISGRIKDDAYFNESATTNPIYGQLTLRFNIIQ